MHKKYCKRSEKGHVAYSVLCTEFGAFQTEYGIFRSEYGSFLTELGYFTKNVIAQFFLRIFLRILRVISKIFGLKIIFWCVLKNLLINYMT